MRKLKTWQLVLLIIFYPVGLVYFIIWLCKKNNNNSSIVRDLHTKVVGVTFGNSDGSSRQEIIRKCRVGESVVFKPVPTADFPDAIGVFNKRGQQLGHLNAELAAEIKDRYPNNPMSATITHITGGGDKSYGCNMHIVIYANK